MMNDAKILYAEDDADFAALTMAFFRRRGFKVAYAENGDKAWELYHKEMPDVVMLDVKMPNGTIDGFEVAERIRKIDTLTPILFVTSLGGLSDVKRGYSIGCEDYIRKDQIVDEVEIKVRKILENSIKKHGVARISKNSSLYLGARRLNVCGENIALNMREYAILMKLLTHRNHTVSREVLLETAWVKDTGTDNYLSKAMTSLRRYFKPDKSVEIIANYGAGISLSVRNEEPEKV